MMQALKRCFAVIPVLATLAGCAGMTTQEKNTAIGAAVGGVAGSVLSNGSGIGTAGGAAVGGLIGNQIKR